MDLVQSDDGDEELQRALLQSLKRSCSDANGDDDDDEALQKVLLQSVQRAATANDDGTYTIFLQKSEAFNRERKLGITSERDTNSAGERILRLYAWNKGSMFAAWNDSDAAACSKTAVRAGDVIVRVGETEIEGRLDRLDEAVRRAAESEEDTVIPVRLLPRDSESDSAPINRRVLTCTNNTEGPVFANTERYSSVWYNDVGGCWLGLGATGVWGQAEHEIKLQQQVAELDKLASLVRTRRPTILYLVFGGLLPPVHDGTQEQVLRRGDCLERRLPPPLLRLLQKEDEASVLIAILDSDCKRRKRELDLPSGAGAFRDRVSVELVPFDVPRWPCIDVLSRLRSLRDTTVEHGGLFIVLDELKFIRKGCFSQRFALRPVLDLCAELPGSSVFLEWDPYPVCRVQTYRNSEDRENNRYREVWQWNGLNRSNIVRGETDDATKAVFNFITRNRNRAHEGVGKVYSIDLSQKHYQ